MQLKTDTDRPKSDFIVIIEWRFFEDVASIK